MQQVRALRHFEKCSFVDPNAPKIAKRSRFLVGAIFGTTPRIEFPENAEIPHISAFSWGLLDGYPRRLSGYRVQHRVHTTLQVSFILRRVEACIGDLSPITQRRASDRANPSMYN
jgi:hypothetical protein